MKLCRDCGKPLSPTRIKYKSDYCNSMCRQHWLYHNDELYRNKKKLQISKRYAEKYKDPEFRKKRRKDFKKWLEKNRKKYNAYYKKYRDQEPEKYRKYYRDYWHNVTKKKLKK